MNRCLSALVVAVTVSWGWASPAPLLVRAGALAQSAPESTPESARQNAGDETDWQGLPPGNGREQTFFTCSACHSLKTVTQQGLSAARWDEALVWMREEQEMPALEPRDRELIIEYLAEFYGEDRKARGGKTRRR
jgi:hypothetical protein